MRLKELREIKGWSQAKLAEEAKLSQSFIHYVETGKKDATSKIVVRLANALGVSVSELLGERDVKLNL